MKRDTIVAIGTPSGVGGIAVVRLSGHDALSIALNHLSVRTLTPRHATYCRFDNLDDIVVTWFPQGYTGESTVELACHGSRYVQQAVLESLTASGARLADRGEFTMRAFLNGRLNLSQAEAVADLIEATTPAQHRLAVSQLRGGYAQKLSSLRQQLLDLTSLFELELDFSQEDVEFADRSQLLTLIDTIGGETSALIDSFRMGNAIKRGIPVAIVGAPNVGKSTLLNALLNDERAIVSAIPGTTRDTIEETLNIGNLTFRLIDTAGLRHTDDEVERLGIERSRKAREQAMISINVIDATQPEQALDDIQPSDGKHIITVINKADLIGDDARVKAANYGGEATVCLSALHGEGIDRLKRAMLDAVGDGIPEGDTMLTNARHHEALLHVQQSLDNARQGLNDRLPADLVAVDLRDALYHLGTITGDATSNDVLSNIFSRFCVGK
ncbi:MAG: tRNA uridine-5-carboxymethylaminomethyl(34) synthesis GTPase MnmE [Bacteroidales bacterium]|nr:tRNA uridine-5-carboxymethylaminomethyl(34) synthesis GTPase MnmE [Bacteroidales bacterium]